MASESCAVRVSEQVAQEAVVTLAAKLEELTELIEPTDLMYLTKLKNLRQLARPT